MKRRMERDFFTFLGAILSFALVSCTSGNEFPIPFNAAQDKSKADSAQSNLPSAPNEALAESMPEVCECVLRFDHIGIEQGLSQSSVRAIFQDSRGFLWFGTQDGLNRYDGYTFKIFKPDPDNPNSLNDRWITSIAEDRGGFVWIGTRQGGLNRYDPRTGDFRHYRHSEADSTSLSNDHVNIIFLDKSGSLWIGTQSGLDLFNPGAETFSKFIYNPVTPEDDLDSQSVITIHQDVRGRFWIGTSSSGLIQFEVQNQTFTPHQFNPDDPNTISNDHVTDIIDGGNSTLWVATSNGLNRFMPDAGRFERFIHSEHDPDSLVGNRVNALQMDRAGNLWIATTEGLDRFGKEGDRFIHYTSDPSFSQSMSNDHILSIHEDRGGVLWFGTHGGGVNKYDRLSDNFAYYRNVPNDPNTLSGNQVGSIHVDSEGYAWIGTLDSGLNRLNWTNGHVIRHQHFDSKPNSLASNTVYSVYEDQDRILWIGTANGLDRFDRRSLGFTHFQRNPSKPDSLSANIVYSVFVDSGNNVWVGTVGGLDLLDRETGAFKHYVPQAGNPNSLSSYVIDVIYEDRAGNLWVGTPEHGLNKLNRETDTFTQYHYDPNNKLSLSNDSILSIYQDEKGRLWIGTGGGGLNLYNPQTDTFSYFLEKDGLPNGVVYGILEDENGYLWLSTNRGISRFDPQTKTFHNFDSGDGLQGNEFNVDAFAKGKSGEFYFGGINGLTIFHPLNINQNSYLPQITLTSLSQGDQPVITDSSIETVRDITIQWPRNSLEFEFAALSYNQPNKNQYAYYLEGFDPNWHYIGTKRFGSYTNLPGGEYKLKLKVANNDGIWNETPVEINVTVIPPFWETTWFRILLVFTLVGAVAGGIRLRTKAIQDRNRQLERVVRERTSALEKRSQEIQALYLADERILRNVSLQQVFQTLVDVAVDTLDADRSIVFAWDEKQTKVVPRVSRGFLPETLKTLEFAKGEGFIGKVLETGVPSIVRQVDLNDFRKDIREALIAENIRSFVHLPIIVDHKIVGVFNVGFTKPNLIGDDTTRLFSALTHRASISIANMELFEQTKDLAVMEERNRLARDLHDSAKQKAFAALAQLGTARGMLNGNGNSVTMHLTEAENLVSDVIQELTFLVQEIYPIALQEKGLATALREYIYEWENRNDAGAHLTTRNERRLSLDVEQAIYRIAQESLANVSRHSHASRVDVSLEYNGDSVQLSISDDGCGFDMNHKSHGMGLRSIRERTGSIHGTVQVQSAPGQGVKILVQVPAKG